MKKQILIVIYEVIFIEVLWFLIILFRNKNMEIVYKLSIGEVFNILILAVTALIVWKYTKEAQKSNEIQERPILNFYLRGHEMKLRNVGNGPAYNIVISEINAKNFIYTASFNQANFILEHQKDEKMLTFDVKTPAGGMEIFESEPRDFQLFIDRAFSRDTDPEQYDSLKRVNAIFLINYQGLNDKFYYSIFRLYPKAWPLLNTYNLVIEYIESGNAKCEMSEARETCIKKNIPPSLSVA